MISVTIVGNAEQLTGFQYFWLKHVRDYRLDVHCARCLIGKYDRRINRAMALNERIEFPESDLIYLCGGTNRWHDNLHAAARPAMGKRFSVSMHNGMEAVFDNAEQIAFPSLPDGHAGKDKTFTTCRNYQFAVHMSEGRSASILA